MEIQEYLEKKKKIQQNILDYINANENYTEFKQNLTELLKKHKYTNNRQELSSLLYLVSKISENHHHTAHFYEKLESILSIYKQDIKEIFSNQEIFKIFHGNKRLLLYLHEEQLFTFDSTISNQFLKKSKYIKSNYSTYFYPEIKPFIDEELFQKMHKNQQYLKEIFENGSEFERKRKIGNNYCYICKLIRKDLLKRFIEYVTKDNCSVNSTIVPSLFETNKFLADKEPSLIEYAAFYGSIQIFKYLCSNKAELRPSLWLYAIHSKNLELIHLIGELNVKSNLTSYEDCIIESLKCHHIDLANYFIENLAKVKFDVNEDNLILKNAIKYFNYFYFPTNLNNKFIFFDLCKYNHVTFVDLLLRLSKIDVNEIIVFNRIFIF